MILSNLHFNKALYIFAAWKWSLRKCERYTRQNRSAKWFSLTTFSVQPRNKKTRK